eukprot:120731-Rhodomonas_salina.1
MPRSTATFNGCASPDTQDPLCNLMSTQLGSQAIPLWLTCMSASLALSWTTSGTARAPPQSLHACSASSTPRSPRSSNQHPLSLSPSCCPPHASSGGTALCTRARLTASTNAAAAHAAEWCVSRLTRTELFGAANSNTKSPNAAAESCAAVSVASTTTSAAPPAPWPATCTRSEGAASADSEGILAARRESRRSSPGSSPPTCCCKESPAPCSPTLGVPEDSHDDGERKAQPLRLAGPSAASASKCPLASGRRGGARGREQSTSGSSWWQSRSLHCHALSASTHCSPPVSPAHGRAFQSS